MTQKEFILNWYNKISGEGLKVFPADFITTEKLSSISLPAKTLVLGSELFGKYEITTVDGIPAIQADDYIYAKYILYANRTKPISINIPAEHESIKNTVLKYEEYLDSIIKRIENDFKKRFPDSPDIYTAVNQILNKLNITRL